MGNVTDMIMQGVLCEKCGAIMDDEKVPGFPRTCKDCQEEEERC